MSRTRYQFCEDHYPHFVTCTIVAWLPVFATRRFANIVLDSLRFLQRKRDIKVFAFVIMENHLHCIIAGPEIGKRVGEFKSFTARKIIDEMHAMNYLTMLQELSFYKLRCKVDQDHQLWQQGNHPKVIECEFTMQQKVDYVHNNPVKRGYVDQPTDWRYSSARNYAGLEGVLSVDCDW